MKILLLLNVPILHNKLGIFEHQCIKQIELLKFKRWQKNPPPLFRTQKKTTPDWDRFIY